MAARGRVLIVDDNVGNIELAVEVLEDEYELRTAQSGREALGILPEFSPDVVLLDIMMPDMDGHEVCRAIRQDSALRNTKVIFVSAKALPADRLQGYESGADDYVIKPFDLEELLSKVRVFCRLKSVEEVDQLKSDVLSLFRHETRTPLSGIVLPAEMLAAGGDTSAEERAELANMVLESARELQRLLEKVEKLVAVKSGAWRMEFVPGNLGTMAREAVATVAPHAGRNDIAINERLDADPEVRVDAQEITDCLVELLMNAVRVSSPGGRIHLSLCVVGSTACLRVADEGPGIARSFLPQVFQGLSCPDVEHHSSGHGLGLALVRQVVLRHGGSVHVESEEGAGATFTLRLPLAHEPSP